MRQGKKRKALAWLAVLALLFCQQGIVFAAEGANPFAPTATFTVATAETKAGTAVTVPVRFSENQLPVINGAVLGIYYDTDVLEFVSISGGALCEDGNAIYTFNDKIAAGYVQLVSTLVKGITATSGTFANVRFRVKDGIPVGTTANVTLTVEEMVDEKDQNIELSGIEVQNGSVLVPSRVDFVMGDVTAASAQEDVQVPVMIKNNRTGIGGYAYKVQYDPAVLTYQGVDVDADSKLVVTHEDAPEEVAENEIKVNALHGNAIKESAASLEVFHFSAAEALRDTETALTLVLEDVVQDDESGSSIPLEEVVVQSGTVTVLSKYDATISAGDVTVEEGQREFSVPVSIANNRLPFGGMGIGVRYDSEIVEYTGYTLDKFPADLCTVNDWELEEGDSRHMVKVYFLANNHDFSFAEREGDLFHLIFRVKNPSKSAVTSMEIETFDLIGPDSVEYENIELEYENGTVTIPADLSEAKDAAAQKVNEAFSAYDEQNYSADNWNDLTAAKDAALQAIEAAEDEETTEQAAESGIQAMADVYRLGDIDRDRDIDTEDVLLALKVASGEQEWMDSYLREGDMNRDGKISSIDGLLILRQAVQ